MNPYGTIERFFLCMNSEHYVKLNTKINHSLPFYLHLKLFSSV